MYDEGVIMYELRKTIGNRTIEVYYSPDEGAFYGVAWNRVTGKSIGDTGLFPTAKQAMTAASKIK